ncbi:MAG: class I SAM-dependent methyltransferase [Candidatus Omnitrophica bacterium]|nr:class I SAM-dependent methyltransferase [Candidatus Omnitrophota bacterium]
MSRKSYGTSHLSLIDRWGTWLSRRAINRSLGDRSGISVLEIGCGYQARNLISIREHAAKMVGCDFNLSPDLKAVPKFEALEMPVESALPVLKGRQFDVILLISVLEHLMDPLETLMACYQMLNHAGTLLVSVPTWRGKYFLELTSFRLNLSQTGAKEMDDHKMYYDKRDLWPLLVKAGFKPSGIDMRYYKFGLNLYAQVRKV